MTKENKLPAGSNPLARAVGRRIAYVMDERGVDFPTASDQMGISKLRLKSLLAGAQVPNERETKRIAMWMWDGADFTKDPLPKTRAVIRKVNGWRRIHLDLPPDVYKRVKQAAYRLGMSMNSFAFLAAERLLDHEPVMSTIDEAVARVERARMAAIIAENQDLQVLLKGDLELAIVMGAKLKATKEKNTPMQSHPLLENNEGPAHWLGDDDWEVLE